ncbi:hypothetical protein SLS61_008693 [Didymella pomorum]
MDQSSKPSFNFVNLKHPDDLKDEETQLRIRRLAMTEVGKARRKAKNKRGRNEIVLEIREPTQRKPVIDRLGSGRIDPFGRYPIELDDEARALVANNWVTIFDDVVQLISLDRAFNERQQELAVTSGSWMEPTIYRLLAIRPLLMGDGRENVLEEVCRLGTLLFLAPFWRALGHNPVWTAAISRNLQRVLLQYKTEWHDLRPLLVWTLYFAAVETSDLAERSQFVFMLAIVMSGMQLRVWGEIMEVVKGVLWVDSVFAGSDELISDEVMQIVGQKSAVRVAEQAPFSLFDDLTGTY